MQLQMQINCLFLRFQGTEESKSIKHFVGIRLIYFMSLVFFLYLLKHQKTTERDQWHEMSREKVYY